MPRTQPHSTIGLVTLGLIEPITGMASDPGSYEPPIVHRVLRADDLVARAVSCEPGLMDEVVRLAADLVSEGAQAIVTTCGYWIAAQAELSRRISVPVFTSSMLLAPMALAVASGGRVLVGAAVGHGLSEDVLLASGVSDAQRACIDVVGMDRKPLFASMILRSGGISDPESLHDEIADTVVAAAGGEPATRAIILECADMSVASEAIRQRTGLPVFDAVMLGEIARRSITPSVRT